MSERLLVGRTSHFLAALALLASVGVARGDVLIEVGSAGPLGPGDTSSIDVVLGVVTGTAVAGTENEVAFGPEVQLSECEVNPAIDKGASAFSMQPSGCTPEVDCDRVKALILSFSNFDPIPEGSVLYTCKVTVAADAPGAVYPLTCENPGASDPNGDPLPTACTNGAVTVVESSIVVGTAEGAAGETVSVDVTLEVAGSAEVAGTENLVVFKNTTGLPGGVQITGCAVNPAIDKGASAFSLQPGGCTAGVDCEQVKALILSFSNFDPIPSGSVLYTCQVAIDASSEPGAEFPLVCEDPGASDPDGEPVSAACVSGLVKVPSGPTVTPTDTPTDTPVVDTPTVTPTGTPTDTQVNTPTVTPTPTPTSGGLIVLGPVSGVPGGTVNLDVTLLSNTAISGTENVVNFENTTGLPGGVQLADCVVNPEIDKTASAFAFQPTGCTAGTDCDAVKALILSFSNTNPIPDGARLYSCDVGINPASVAGLYPLVCEDPDGSDPDGDPVPTGCTNTNVVVSTVESFFLEADVPFDSGATSPQEPTQVEILSPVNVDGTLTIQPATGEVPGSQLAGNSLLIHLATTVGGMQFTLNLDASAVPDGVVPDEVEIFDGVGFLLNCDDPLAGNVCIVDRRDVGGAVEVDVRSDSPASDFDFTFAFPVALPTPTPTDTPADITPTDTPTGTPVGTATATLTPTGTPTQGAEAEIVLGPVEGQPAGTVSLNVQLLTNADVAGTDNAIDFANTTELPGGVQLFDCEVNEAIGKEGLFFFSPEGCTEGTDCDLVDAEINGTPGLIPNGERLYSCKVAIDAESVPGKYPLVCEDPAAFDPSGGDVPAVCTSTEVVVFTLEELFLEAGVPFDSGDTSPDEPTQVGILSDVDAGGGLRIQPPTGVEPSLVGNQLLINLTEPVNGGGAGGGRVTVLTYTLKLDASAVPTDTDPTSAEIFDGSGFLLNCDDPLVGDECIASREAVGGGSRVVVESSRSFGAFDFTFAFPGVPPTPTFVPTNTPTQKPGPTIIIIEDDSCQIVAPANSRYGWMLLLPMAVLFWLRRRTS